jgi:hypothetical protein
MSKNAFNFCSSFLLIDKRTESRLRSKAKKISDDEKQFSSFLRKNFNLFYRLYVRKQAQKHRQSFPIIDSVEDNFTRQH